MNTEATKLSDNPKHQ